MVVNPLALKLMQRKSSVKHERQHMGSHNMQAFNYMYLINETSMQKQPSCEKSVQPRVKKCEIKGGGQVIIV